MSVALHAVLITSTYVKFTRKSDEPLGVLVERYGNAGEQTPTLSEVALSYELPSDVSLGKQKKRLRKQPAATRTEEFRLGNSSSGAGATSGVIGVPDGIVASSKERYLYELRLLLDQRKRYPSAARTLGQKGSVQVAFEISKDGTIGNVAVVGPSEYDRLNQAALDLVRNTEKYKPIPDELGLDKWQLTVPIRYELN